MMNSAAYPEDSRTAVLRIAILVAYSDGSWHDLERAHLEDIFRNICVMLDEDLDDDAILRELDEISTDVPTEIEALVDAVAAALALAVGDSEIDAGELSGIARLCDESLLSAAKYGVYRGQETPHFHFHVVPRQIGSDWGIGPPHFAHFEGAGRRRGTSHDPSGDAQRRARVQLPAGKLIATANLIRSNLLNQSILSQKEEP